MALRDQPYLPLFVQDFLTDEKLMECSASATGVYIRIMCVMHKSETYGKILLKQKDKQTGDQINNFALKLVRHLPFNFDTILAGIKELCQEKCLVIEGDFLVQKRMVNDGELSLIRSKSGSKGGKTTQIKNKNFAKAKIKANTEIEYEYENENINDKENGVKKNEKSEIQLPFPGKDFSDIWEEWLIYRKQKRIKQYVPVGLKRTFSDLVEMSGNDEKFAIQIIKHTMSKGWQGLQPPNTFKNGTSNIGNITSGDSKNGSPNSRIQAAKDY